MVDIMELPLVRTPKASIPPLPLRKEPTSFLTICSRANNYTSYIQGVKPFQSPRQLMVSLCTGSDGGRRCSQSWRTFHDYSSNIILILHVNFRWNLTGWVYISSLSVQAKKATNRYTFCVYNLQAMLLTSSSTCRFRLVCTIGITMGMCKFKFKLTGY